MDVVPITDVPITDVPMGLIARSVRRAAAGSSPGGSGTATAGCAVRSRSAAQSAAPATAGNSEIDHRNRALSGALFTEASISQEIGFPAMQGLGLRGEAPVG